MYQNKIFKKGRAWDVKKKLWWEMKPERSHIESDFVSVIKQWEFCKEISKKGNLEEKDCY